jgi:hypothetical protein
MQIQPLTRIFSEAGPLPSDIVELLDKAWAKSKSVVPYYASL